MRKKLSFLSFSRSDYTSLRSLIKDTIASELFDVEVVAGGSHLLQRFGRSIDKFDEDGITIHTRCDFLIDNDDSDDDMARASALAYSQIYNYFHASKPDYVFILGDRWEMLPATMAAFLMRIPVIHHSGGDVTQGALDNQIRYSLSAMAQFHLVGMEEHRLRLLAMGEESWRVITTGEPALTEIHKIAGSVHDFYNQIGLKEGEAFALATFHPTTFDDLPREKQIEVFLETLGHIRIPIILTAPNPDPGSKFFLEKIESFQATNSHIRFFENLGSKLYYAAMSRAQFMVGNSSSGIWEAPSFQLPVLNLGQRQNGRTRAGNVVDVKLDLTGILKGLEKVSSEDFKRSLKGIVNPYGTQNTNQLIIDAIRTLPERDVLLHKRLVDPLKSANE